MHVDLMEAMTTVILGASDPLMDDIAFPPEPIPLLRRSRTRHYVFARTLMVPTVALEARRNILEEVAVCESTYRVCRTVFTSRVGPVRVLTAHVPADKGYSQCTLIATRDTPWQPAGAIEALAHAFTGIGDIG